MAVPTASTTTRNSGTGFILTWHAVWATTDNFTASSIVDLSSFAYTNKLKITHLHINATAGISVALLFDATSDEMIYRHPLGNLGPVDIDFTHSPDGGLVKTAAGGSGDVVLTTTSAASGDEVSIVIQGVCN